MRTSFIAGKEVSKLDASLVAILSSPQLDPQYVWSESLLIGVRNEHNEIYRIIGVTGMSRFIDVMWELHALGYTEVAANDYEEEQGFDVVVAARAISTAH